MTPTAAGSLPAMTTTTFVDLDSARATKGLRLVVAAGIPSPWSEAAKGIFRVKRVPFVAVRLGTFDGEVKKWTRSRNAPAAMYEDEPARTGWADILELAERLAPEPSLVPAAPAERVRMFGLSHEVMGEGGLLWSGRLVTIAEGLATDGARGFPPMVGHYLGARYGFTPERVAVARARAAESIALLSEALGDRPYYFGEFVTALDVYSAAAMNILDPLPEDQCAILPPIRAAFESMKDLLAVPPALVAHRARMYERHLELPIVT
jgi:glutathione S-transferase